MVSTTSQGLPDHGASQERPRRSLRRRGAGVLDGMLGGVLASAVVATALIAAPAAQATPPTPIVWGPGNFSWTVPSGMTKVRVELAGGRGGNAQGGFGGIVSGTLAVSPGQQYQIVVGTEGGTGSTGGGSSSGGGAGWGWSYGGEGGSGSGMVGSAGQGGGGGGGSSAITLVGGSGSPLAVAAGGGGGGGDGFCHGNPGGSAGESGWKDDHSGGLCGSDGGNPGGAGAAGGNTGTKGENADSSSGQGGGGGGGGGLPGGGRGASSTDGGGGGGGGISSAAGLSAGQLGQGSTGNGYLRLIPVWDTVTVLAQASYGGAPGTRLELAGSVSVVSGGTGVPEGTVEFLAADGGAPAAFGSAVLAADGSFSYSCTLPCGIAATSTQLVAKYVPPTAGAWTASQTTAGFGVVQGSTRTDLEVDPGRVVTGQDLELTATVNPVRPAEEVPGGTVEFIATRASDGAQQSLGNPAVGPSGRVVLHAPAPFMGEQQIRAVYTGGGWLEGSSSPRRTVQNDRARTVVTATVAPEPGVFGEGSTVHVTVAPVTPGAGTPQGDVTIDGETVTLSGGSAQLIRPGRSAGTEQIAVAYLGSEEFEPSQTVATHVTDRANATLTLSENVSQSRFGQPVKLTLSATLAAPAAGQASGPVKIWVDGAYAGVSAQLTGSAATATLRNLAVGTHTIEARYAGSSDVNPAVSNQVVQLVTKTTAVVTATPRRSTITVGTDAIVHVAVTSSAAPGAPGDGTVQLRLGSASGKVLARGALGRDGTVDLKWKRPKVGKAKVVAVYSGSRNLAPARSAKRSIRVLKAVSRTSLTAPARMPSYQQLVLNAKVTTGESSKVSHGWASGMTRSSARSGAWHPFRATGKVKFTIDGRPYGGAVSLRSLKGSKTSATATLRLWLSPGVHRVTVNYPGTSKVSASKSRELTVTVWKPVPVPRRACCC